MNGALPGARVRLSAPDGRCFDFFVDDLIPYAGDTYVVLCRDGQGEQLLVTHLETDADGAPVFEVVGDENTIERVLERRVAKLISRSMARENQSENVCPHDCRH